MKQVCLDSLISMNTTLENGLIKRLWLKQSVQMSVPFVKNSFTRKSEPLDVNTDQSRLSSCNFNTLSSSRW